jgi:cytochrome c553
MKRGSLKLFQNIKALLGPKPGWTGLKRWLLQVVTLGLLVGTGGFLVAALGLIPIKASSGHWPITAWLLHFTMIRSVSTHTLGVEVPELDQPGMVLKGASHYATGCFPCHGDPSTHHPHIAMQMTPHPPYLPPIVDQWEPEELFYIVKHGVKFTGMPAWPAQERDDEVWAIVAFLKKFPDLDEREYQRMVNGDSKTEGKHLPLEVLSGRNVPSQSIIDSCNRCHGLEGRGREAGLAPKLSGQKYEYLEASLEAYSQGNRHSGIMEPIAVALSREARREIAQFYSKLDTMPDAVVVEPKVYSEEDLATIGHGETIVRNGVPNARIPVCSQCHGPNDNPRNSAYPNLAGQYADYLLLQLKLFASDSRGGSDFASLMHPVARQLTSKQMREVALYYESLNLEN